MAKKIMCCVRKTNEIYEGYKEVAIDSIARQKRLSTKQAEASLEVATEDDPIHLVDETIWLE